MTPQQLQIIGVKETKYKHSVAMVALQIRGNIIDTDQVLVKAKGGARILTLNRPKQLNAITAEMLKIMDQSVPKQVICYRILQVLKMLKLYTIYEEDPKVKIIILKGQGRAFCAGGDLAALMYHINKGNKSYSANFFWNQHILNYIIATYSKPQVSILNGTVMGNGTGISIHGKYRVVTEKTLFATPETAIGGFPDLGASYFLSRIPGYFGEYVGLTGARLNGSEMLACGLATHFVPSEKLDLLEDSLVGMNTSDSISVCGIIDKFSQRKPMGKINAYNRLDIVNRCFSKGTVEEILSALEQEAKPCSDKWIKIAIKSLKKASPTSLKVTLRAIREGRSSQVSHCLVQDYRLSQHLLSKEVDGDFFKGCRALIGRKDEIPRWEPSKLELVEGKMVDIYFSTKLDEELNLPERQNPSISMSKL